jgi:hypothetical protein
MLRCCAALERRTSVRARHSRPPRSRDPWRVKALN